MTTMSSSPRTSSSAFSIAARLLCSRCSYQRRATSSGMSTAICRSGCAPLHLEDVVEQRIEHVPVRRGDDDELRGRQMRRRRRRLDVARASVAPGRLRWLAGSASARRRCPATACSANRSPFCDILFHSLIGRMTIGGWMFDTLSGMRIGDLDRTRGGSGAGRRRTARAASGSSSVITHAPSANFATSTTTRVTPVARAPSPLIDDVERRGARPPARSQCATMPACESVNARNAPTANSGISRSVMPPKTISRNADSAVSDVDALRVHEPAAARREGARQEAVLGDQAAEPREIGEAGVGRQREHRQNRGDADVVERVRWPTTAATSCDSTL